jgi:hypothetical protein
MLSLWPRRGSDEQRAELIDAMLLQPQPADLVEGGMSDLRGLVAIGEATGRQRPNRFERVPVGLGRVSLIREPASDTEVSNAAEHPDLDVGRGRFLAPRPAHIGGSRARAADQQRLPGVPAMTAVTMQCQSTTLTRGARSLAL